MLSESIIFILEKSIKNEIKSEIKTISKRFKNISSILFSLPVRLTRPNTCSILTSSFLSFHLYFKMGLEIDVLNVHLPF